MRGRRFIYDSDKKYKKKNRKKFKVELNFVILNIYRYKWGAKGDISSKKSFFINFGIFFMFHYGPATKSHFVRPS